MLPHRSGVDVCHDVRVAGLATPILLLTARDQIADKVVGLKLGADDYVTKPFDTLELMARVAALLRRAQAHPTHRVLQFGPLRMDVRATEVTRDGKEVVDVHIASLRQKLEKDATHPELILTVKGMGYKFKV
jgi:DNA-binding response OmpR family regulator